MLGLATGIVTSIFILAFRYLIDQGGVTLVGLDSSDNFESLSILERAFWCVGGALILGLLLNRYNPSARRVGVVHVMERLSRHQGYLPLRNAVIQFFGGAIALATGQSGGREGPAIHLGATAASLLGQKFALPNNSIRTMVACGTAAAIAASFNTPIAGVIFAMEVVMMEYAIASFIPIIMASVSATILTQYFFGSAPAFNVAPAVMSSPYELIYLVFAGIIIGAIAAAFIHLVQRFAKLSYWPFWLRMGLAGAITAIAAAALPQVMGVGYDTVNEVMLGQLSIVLLIALMAGKLVTSAATVGLGMPVGLIGPVMFIGACVGGIFGKSLLLVQDLDVSVGLYVMLGMCAMMAAVLQAPLAALMAVMEMTASTSIVLPAMVIITIATLVCSQVFGQKSAYITTLNTLGLQYPPNPVTLHLQRVGATAIMDRSLIRLPSSISNERALEIVANPPAWIIVDKDDGDIRAVLNPSDLAAFMQERGAEEEEIHLLELPGQRMDVCFVDVQATAMEAQAALEKSQAEACCVQRTSVPLIKPVVGIVTRQHLENYRNLS